MVTNPSFGNAHADFKVVDRPLHNGSDLVNGNTFFRIPLDALCRAIPDSVPDLFSSVKIRNFYGG